MKALEQKYAKEGKPPLSQRARDYIGVIPRYEPEEKKETFSEADLNPVQYRQFTEERSATYRRIADSLQSCEAWQSMDNGTWDRLLKSAANLARKTALYNHSGGRYVRDDGSPNLDAWMFWARGGTEYGVSEAQAVLFKTAYDTTEADKDPNGNPVSGSKQKKVLQTVREWMPDLDRQQLLYLQSFYWSTDNSALKKRKENGWKPDE